MQVVWHKILFIKLTSRPCASGWSSFSHACEYVIHLCNYDNDNDSLQSYGRMYVPVPIKLVARTCTAKVLLGIRRRTDQRTNLFQWYESTCQPSCHFVRDKCLLQVLAIRSSSITTNTSVNPSVSNDAHAWPPLTTLDKKSRSISWRHLPKHNIYATNARFPNFVRQYNGRGLRGLCRASPWSGEHK